MKMNILVLIVVILLVGCGEHKMSGYVCDSGFSTGPVWRAILDDGIITWRVKEYGGYYQHRKMIAGEICTYKIYDK